jgi:tetratricopeptide (TPR) repeat protein
LPGGVASRLLPDGPVKTARPSLRIWILLAVAAASFLAQRELSRMDTIFFRLSVPGAKGLGLYLAGRYDAAAKAYREHWRAAIASGVTTGDRGTDLILGGDLTEAERLAQQELRRAPRSTSAMLLLAEVALERDVPATAARLAAEALESAPNDVDAEIMLSVARARDGDAPEAIAALNRALRSGRVGNRLVPFYQVLALTGTLAARPDPGRPLCLIAQYHRYLRVFDHAQARPAARYARRAIAAGDQPADAYVTLGILHDKAGRADDALAAFEAARQADPHHAEAHRWAAVTYGQRGDLLNEYRAITLALEVSGDPFYADYFFEISVNRIGDPARAAALLEPLVARAGNDVHLHERLGRIWALLGDERRALDHYRQAALLAPGDPELQNAIGWALDRLRRPDDAVAALLQAAELAPRWPEPHRRLAGIHYRSNRYPQAIAEAEAARRLGDEDTHLHVLLCNLYHDEVDLTRADACVGDLLRRDPGNVSGLALLPKIRHEAGLR